MAFMSGLATPRTLAVVGWLCLGALAWGQTHKALGYSTWQGHPNQGRLEISLNAQQLSGSFRVGYSWQEQLPAAQPGKVQVTAYEDYALVGSLSGTYNPQNGFVQGTVGGVWEFETMRKGFPYPYGDSIAMSGSFEGVLQDNVFSGSFKVTFGPAKPDIPAPPASANGELVAVFLAQKGPTTNTGSFKEEVLLRNLNDQAAQNQPSAPTVLKLDRTTFITYLLTYHWNGGKGKTPSTLALRDAAGKVYGPWKAYGLSAGNTSNGYWITRPNLALPAGTYTIVDGDPSTWSHNAASGGQGMAEVWGIKNRNR